jgi:hypothetical protein
MPKTALQNCGDTSGAPDAHCKTAGGFQACRKELCKTAARFQAHRKCIAKLREGFRRAESHVAKLRERFGCAGSVPAVFLQLNKFTKLFPQIF